MFLVPGFVCADKTAEYCPQPDRFTPDGLFALGVETEGHDGLFGGWIETRARGFLYSTSRHAQIGELDLTHYSPYLKLASADGQDYLLVLNAGSELTVYQLFDSDAVPTK